MGVLAVIASLLLAHAGSAGAWSGQNNEFGLDVQIASNLTADAPIAVKFASSANLTSYTEPVSVLLYNSVSNVPVCSFGHNTTLAALSTTLTIPSSVGPAGYYYRLALIPGLVPDLFGKLDSWPFGFPSYSHLFFLSNATASWSSAELAQPESGLDYFFGGYSFSAGGTLPCDAYGCARECSYKQLPYPEAWKTGQPWRTCLDACPGVTLDSAALSSIAAEAASTPSPTAASVLAAPTGCDAADFQTPCGGECCGPSEYCFAWTECRKVDASDATDVPTSGIARSTSAVSRSPAASTTTGAAMTMTTTTTTSVNAAAKPTALSRLSPIPAAVGILWAVLG